MYQRRTAQSTAVGQVVTPAGYPIAARLNLIAVRRWMVAHAESLWIAGILLVAGVAHGTNMLHFPYYETDEGTYMSQAWALLHEGHLAPYTYWYDHAPLGWIQIAVWAALTGGFYTFGTAVDSGRVLMLVMQLASTWMVYRIGRKVSGSVLAASVAALTFALSAYAIYYHRRVLLDNICTFWMLLCILLLVHEHFTLSRVWLSGLALGTSILSKELTVFLVPCLLWLVYDRADQTQRRFAVVTWIAIVGAIVSTYFLMATLKGELFPSGTPLGGTSPHVSLLGTLSFQADRGRDGGLLDPHSAFWNAARQWASIEPFLVVVGSACALLSLLALRRNRRLAIIGLATLSLWAFLARGGVVIGFYLVPLLPMLALSAGLVIGTVSSRIAGWLRATGPVGLVVGVGIQTLTGALCLALLLPGYDNPQLGFRSDHLELWHNTQADAQRASMAWVLHHIAPNSLIIIDNYMWTDLHDPADGSKGFRYAHWHWKVDLDPAIRDRVFHGDWRNVDYVVTTPQLLTDMRTGNLQIVTAAVQHSTLVAHFDTGGWPIDVRVVNKPQRTGAGKPNTQG